MTTSNLFTWKCSRFCIDGDVDMSDNYNGCSAIFSHEMKIYVDWDQFNLYINGNGMSNYPMNIDFTKATHLGRTQLGFTQHEPYKQKTTELGNINILIIPMQSPPQTNALDIVNSRMLTS